MLTAAAMLTVLGPARAEVSVRDAMATTVTLARPARRIVTLVPHATELVYAAGAGDRMVGTVDYSDYPPSAKKLPRIGSMMGVSLEAILRVQPDLVIAWKDGTSPQTIARLREQGVAVYVSRPVQLDDVAREILALGHLAGTDAAAARSAAVFRQRLAKLVTRYRGRSPVSVYYQVSPAPIFTLSDASFIGAVLHLCGGRNVFGALAVPAPQVSLESVVAARPQVMLAGSLSELAMWTQWRSIPAVAHGTFYAINTDLASRPGPRLADAAEAICATLDTARQKLGLTPR
jgi:iron complex transport system substrate-binding protein/vitamin B12 transport system substrate-binding protein